MEPSLEDRTAVTSKALKTHPRHTESTITFDERAKNPRIPLLEQFFMYYATLLRTGAKFLSPKRARSSFSRTD
jgi:hypothetical protein